MAMGEPAAHAVLVRKSAVGALLAAPLESRASPAPTNRLPLTTVRLPRSRRSLAMTMQKHPVRLL